MAPNGWSSWAKWNKDLGQTLADAQRAHAGDDSIDEARARSRGVPSVLDVHELAAKRARALRHALAEYELRSYTITPGRALGEALAR